ncbi:hypothetical protein EDC96DRAFT_508786 [Choanephora cucurbitarum]|nr:hypothetical protein EDC96DRAFT_508786 [Choanephora cucurbitarum]
MHNSYQLLYMSCVMHIFYCFLLMISGVICSINLANRTIGISCVSLFFLWWEQKYVKGVPERNTKICLYPLFA